MKCDKCNFEIKNNNFKKHYNSCDGKGPYKQTLVCPYCHKTWEELSISGKKIGCHIKWCNDNPNKHESYISNLDYARSCITEASRKLAGEKIRKLHREGKYDNIKRESFLGKHHTKESKDKISKALKLSHFNGLHPGWSHINSNISRMSYPEKYFYTCMLNYGLFDEYIITIHKKVNKYFLDFSFDEYQLDVEIDGIQHIRDDKNIRHDDIRNEFLIANGWKVYRILWKDFISNPTDNFIKFIQYLKLKNKPDLVKY